MRRTVDGMDIDWTHELLDQLGFHWDDVLRPRLDALTDEQYLLGAGRRDVEHPPPRGRDGRRWPPAPATP